MPAENTALTTRSPTARARVSNGSDVLPNVDGRSALARRYRDIVAAVIADQAGEDRCSEARLQLIRRFAAAACLAEAMEARLANGASIDIGEHALLCSTLVRLANKLGIERRSRNVVPDLADYLAEHAAGEAAA